MNEIDPRADERSFYDDSDYADVDLELADDVHVVPPLAPRSTFALRLDGTTIEQLRALARRRGARPTQLAREWLTERLAQEQSKTLGTEAATPPDRSSKGLPRDTVAAVGELLLDKPVEVDPIEDRITNLEQAFVRFAGRHVRGTTPAGSKDADLVAELETRAQVARELWQRLDPAATVEARTDAGADLVVGHGRQTWVIEITSGHGDIVPSLRHVLALAAQLGARPVLVSSRPPSKDIEALSTLSGVFVARSDDLDELLVEMAADPRAGG